MSQTTSDSTTGVEPLNIVQNNYENNSQNRNESGKFPFVTPSLSQEFILSQTQELNDSYKAAEYLANLANPSINDNFYVNSNNEIRIGSNSAYKYQSQELSMSQTQLLSQQSFPSSQEKNFTLSQSFNHPPETQEPSSLCASYLSNSLPTVTSNTTNTEPSKDNVQIQSSKMAVKREERRAREKTGVVQLIPEKRQIKKLGNITIKKVKTKRRKHGKPSFQILFCGDIEGHIREVITKITKLNNSKLGPFDVLFCIGKFLDENNHINIDSSITFPIPTYVIIKDDIISNELMVELKKVHNLTIITDVDYITIQNLRVLCIPGVYDKERYLDETTISPCYYRKSQIDMILNKANSAPVDFVFSAEWAKGMLRFVDPMKYPSIPNCTSVGSPIIEDVLRAVCPRYHFAASMNVFYERVPYRNTNQHITRIVCLGPVKAASDKSRKWLHALKVSPSIEMREDELIQCDSICTSNPFDTLKRNSSEVENNPEKVPKIGLTENEMKHIEREIQQPHQNYRFSIQSSSQSRSNCWFCLAAPNVEKQLIVNVDENAYIAIPKGQLTTGHVLIIPVIHRQSTIELPQEALNNIEQYKKALVKMFHDQKKAVLMWERNLTTRNPVHCHIQVVPIDAAKESVVKIVLDAAATQRGFRFTEIPNNQNLKEFAGNEDFLYAEVWGVNSTEPKRYGYVVKERRPQMQFFHQAVGSLLETTNAGSDWTALQKSVDEEAEIASDFRAMFKPYDFTAEAKK